MNNIEKYLVKKFNEIYKNTISFKNKKIIIIDKNKNKCYLIRCNNDNNITILKESKKYKNIVKQFQNLFPEINFKTTKNSPFKFIHLFKEDIDNEIIIGTENNNIITWGGFGIYEI